MKKYNFAILLILVFFASINFNIEAFSIGLSENVEIDNTKQLPSFSYDFDNFSHFVETYNSVSEVEKKTVLEDYLSWQETSGGGFPAIQNTTYVVFIYYNPSLMIDVCGIVGDFTAYNIRNMIQDEICIRTKRIRFWIEYCSIKIKDNSFYHN